MNSENQKTQQISRQLSLMETNERSWLSIRTQIPQSSQRDTFNINGYFNSVMIIVFNSNHGKSRIVLCKLLREMAIIIELYPQQNCFPGVRTKQITYACVHMSMYVYVCFYMWKPELTLVQFISRNPHCVLRRDLSLAWDSLMMLGWLASKPQRSSCLPSQH